MYKSRGKPYEARNIAIAKQQLALAETIRVSPIENVPKLTGRNLLKSDQGSKLEHKQQRQHFEAFREAYKERRGQRNEEKYQNTSLEAKDDFEPSPIMKDFLARYGIKKIDQTKKTKVEQKPVLMRNILQSTKPIYPLEKLHYGKEPVSLAKPQVVRRPQIAGEVTKDVVKQLKEIEAQFVNDSISTENICSIQDKNILFSQLKATENQISIASSQLQAIQQMLRDKKMLATVEEDEEQIYDLKNKQKSQNTKWRVKNTIRNTQNKRTRLVDTLNMLNNRLQTMQDKYFNAPKVHYKTFDDLTLKIQGKQRKGVETIYENRKYDYDSKTDIDLKPTISSELKTISPKYINRIKRVKSEPKVKSNSADHSTDMLQCKNSEESSSVTSSSDIVAKQKRKFDRKSSAELLSDISMSSSILFVPPNKSSSDQFQYKNMSFNHDDSYDGSVSDELEKDIDKTIMKSNYLKKEFDYLREKSTSKANKNVRFTESVVKVASDVDIDRSPAADRLQSMYTRFESLLGNSLYTTAD